MTVRKCNVSVPSWHRFFLYFVVYFLNIIRERSLSMGGRVQWNLYTFSSTIFNNVKKHPQIRAKKCIFKVSPQHLDNV